MKTKDKKSKQKTKEEFQRDDNLLIYDFANYYDFLIRIKNK